MFAEHGCHWTLMACCTSKQLSCRYQPVFHDPNSFRSTYLALARPTALTLRACLQERNTSTAPPVLSHKDDIRTESSKNISKARRAATKLVSTLAGSQSCLLPCTYKMSGLPLPGSEIRASTDICVSHPDPQMLSPSRLPVAPAGAESEQLLGQHWSEGRP